MGQIKEKPYRPNVGMIVFNAMGEVLVGERFLFPGAWQFPQGGIDQGEEPLSAARRELYEEVGVQDEILVGEYPDWINYDFPSDLGITGKLKKFRGQTQKWFLFYWDHPIQDCDLDIHEREFNQIRFMKLDEVVQNIVEFKKPAYKILAEYFQPILDSYLAKRNQSL